MNPALFGWDDTIRPQRALSVSPSTSDSHKRKRGRDSGPDLFAACSPRRMAVKRARAASRPSFAIPVRRRLEGLSHQQLFELVENICEHHPEFHNQIARLAPQITVESAMVSLKQYLQCLLEGIPYSSDDKLSDYGYLRVQPMLQDFFVALADYTVALLPPNEQSLHRSLEFLDQATDLVHNVPDWDNNANNFLKNRAYGELSGAWSHCLQLMAERSHLVRFDTEGRLSYHTRSSGGRLQVEVTQPVLSIAERGEPTALPTNLCF